MGLVVRFHYRVELVVRYRAQGKLVGSIQVLVGRGGYVKVSK